MGNKLRLATVFSGIGAIEFALHRLNIDYEVIFACDNGEVEIDYNLEDEFNKIRSMASIDDKRQYVDDLYISKTRRTNFVEITYLNNYPQASKERYFQDIRLLDGRDFEHQVDLFVGGSPCQSFSSIGFQKGLDDARGTLFYDYARLIEEIKPKVFIYENVRGMLNHDKGNTWQVIEGIFNSLDYDISYDILDAQDFGIPQKRKRLFVVGTKRGSGFDIKKCEKKPHKYTAQDFLFENNDFNSILSNEKGELVMHNVKGSVEEKYFLTPKLYAYVMKGGTKTFYQKPVIDLPIARTILKTMGNRHRAGIDNYYSINGRVRMLAEREALRLMGFTDEFKIVVSRSQAYKQAGNSIVVDVLMAIIKELKKTNIL